MSAIDRRNRRRNRFFVRFEFDDTRISEKFLRYLRIRMMTRTVTFSLKSTPWNGVYTYHCSKHLQDR